MQEHKFFPFASCDIDLTSGDAEGGAVAMNYLINEVYILLIINKLVAWSRMLNFFLN
jgi:hypothetical protein